MRGPRFGRSGLLGWAGSLLCVLALVAVVTPGVGYTRALADEGVRLDGSAQHVLLPADRTYGIYIDDADNSGYSLNCSAVDARGREIHLADPSWSLGYSETEVLDLVFNTGSGELTINCAIPGEHVTARPVPNDRAMLLGIVLAAILGCRSPSSTSATAARSSASAIPRATLGLSSSSRVRLPSPSSRWRAGAGSSRTDPTHSHAANRATRGRSAGAFSRLVAPQMRGA